MGSNQHTADSASKTAKVKTNGEGSIYRIIQPNGEAAWRAVRTVHSYRHPETGKWVLIRATGTSADKATAREKCDAAYDRKRVALGKLDPAVLNSSPTELRLTVGDWMTSWLERKRGGHKPLGIDTYRNYEAKIRLHIIPALGSTPLRLLSTEQCEQFIHDILPAKTKANGERLLTNDPIRAIHKILKQALQEAMEREKIHRNPMATVEMPAKPNRELEGNRIATEKIWKTKALHKAIEGFDDEALWQLAFYGLRQSERLGLTDDCFELKSKAQHLTVKQQLAERHFEHGCPTTKEGKHSCGHHSNRCPKKTGSSGFYIKHTTKTKTSTRPLPIVEPFLTVIKAHMEKQELLRQSPEFAPLPGLEKLVFTTPDGKPISHKADTARWKEIQAAAKIPEDQFVRGHLTRHYTVSLLAKLGYDPITVSRIVGWSGPEMMSIYNHSTVKEKVEPLRDALQELAKWNHQRTTHSDRLK